MGSLGASSWHSLENWSEQSEKRHRKVKESASPTVGSESGEMARFLSTSKTTLKHRRCKCNELPSPLW